MLNTDLGYHRHSPFVKRNCRFLPWWKRPNYHSTIFAIVQIRPKVDGENGEDGEMFSLFSLVKISFKIDDGNGDDTPPQMELKSLK
jgi:hypothetical protein